MNGRRMLLAGAGASALAAGAGWAWWQRRGAPATATSAASPAASAPTAGAAEGDIWNSAFDTPTGGTLALTTLRAVVLPARLALVAVAAHSLLDFGWTTSVRRRRNFQRRPPSAPS